MEAEDISKTFQHLCCKTVLCQQILGGVKLTNQVY